MRGGHCVAGGHLGGCGRLSGASGQCFLRLSGLVLRSKGSCFPLQLLYHLSQRLCIGIKELSMHLLHWCSTTWNGSYTSLLDDMHIHRFMHTLHIHAVMTER